MAFARPGRASAQEVAIAPDPDIGGLVLDRSLTPMGKDFYREFAQAWSELGASDGHTVVVSESVLPQNSTLLVIELDGRKAFQTFLARRNGSLRPLATQAAQILMQRALALSSDEFAADMASSGY